MTIAPIQVRDIELFRHPMQTRFPFRYGIASLSQLIHLFVRVSVQIGPHAATGISADGLLPKWFTKNPDTSYQEDDLPNMLRVVRRAGETATELSPKNNLFHWWRELYAIQKQWARQNGIAPLLANLGVSLIERAVVDAICRACGVTLFEFLKSNAAGIELAAVRPELGSLQPADVLPGVPAPSISLRHTIGMADPLNDDDVDDLQIQVADGLPLTLEQNIAAYGLRYFKIKLAGDLESDRHRLTRIAGIINGQVGPHARFTLDANEQFGDIETFRDHFETYRESPLLRDFFDQSLIFVEQPLHRQLALESEVGSALEHWPDAPLIIIDESDADLESLPRAMELGYCGTSHKNCKGIVKGLVNAATIHQARRAGQQAVLSAEDLGNVGPVALMQDLAMVATLGIEHAERNGHHYFAGLSSFPISEQERVARNHGDLYRMRDEGFAAISPASGSIHFGSVLNAPFGYAECPDLSLFAICE